MESLEALYWIWTFAYRKDLYPDVTVAFYGVANF